MLEQIEIRGGGFRPLKDSGSWRIARLGHDPRLNDLETLSTLGRHFRTEEAFVLLRGKAVMVTAGTAGQPRGFEAVGFEAGKVYVVKPGQWHAAVLQPEACLLIVENRDTGAENSENHTLSKEEKLEIRRCVAQAEKAGSGN